MYIKKQKPSERINKITEKILKERNDMRQKYPKIEFDGDVEVLAIIEFLDEEYVEHQGPTMD